jgi:hypothetical protein
VYPFVQDHDANEKDDQGKESWLFNGSLNVPESPENHNVQSERSEKGYPVKEKYVAFYRCDVIHIQ